MNDDPEDLIERHAKELAIEVASISWYPFVLSFSPPRPGIATPTPITFEGTTVGILKSYDPATGHGEAIMDGKVDMKQLVQCHVAGYDFMDFDTHCGLIPK
jgi:hypothetical protein